VSPDHAPDCENLTRQSDFWYLACVLNRAGFSVCFYLFVVQLQRHMEPPHVLNSYNGAYSIDNGDGNQYKILKYCLAHPSVLVLDTHLQRKD